jgi:hypothetical protein
MDAPQLLEVTIQLSATEVKVNENISIDAIVH